MTKWINDAVLDAALDEIRDNANLMTLCSQPPTTRTEAVTTYALADVAMASGDFTKADGDVSGRKLTVAQKTGVTVDTSGMATHRALVDGTRLLHVSEIDYQSGDGRTNTAQGGSSTTIQLDASASATDDAYNDMAVTLVRAADGSSETRIISDYVGSTKTATVPSWSGTAPVSGDTFTVYGQSLTSGNTTTINAHDIELEDPQATH